MRSPKDHKDERLLAALERMRQRNANRPRSGLDASSLAWLREQDRLLVEAERAYKEKHRDVAWRLLHSAQIIEIQLEPPARLQAWAEALRMEAERGKKVEGWRKDATLALLAEDARPSLTDNEPQPLEAAWRARLAEAQRIMAEAAHNEHSRNRSLTEFLMLAGGVAAVASAAVILFAFVGFVPLSAQDLSAWGAFGLLGGSFSAILSMMSGSRKRLPEQSAEYQVTLARAIVGTVSGMAAGLFWSAGFLPIAPAVALAPHVLAFMAGFSERLVLKAMDKTT